MELPLDQQQDIVCYYQTAHEWKVYKSWASPGSIPPFCRLKDSGGEPGKRLRFQAQPDVVDGPLPTLWQQLSNQPDAADLSVLSGELLQAWAKKGRYQWVVLHERGYLLVDPSRGFFLYETAKDALTKVLGAPTEYMEAVRGDPANAEFGVPTEGELIPWSSQPLKLPPGGMPDSYRMAVFKLPVSFEDAYVEEAVSAGPSATPAPPGAPGGGGGAPTPAPPGAPRPASSSPAENPPASSAPAVPSAPSVPPAENPPASSSPAPAGTPPSSP